MINIQDPLKCCGCSACESVCNHNAITMQPDAMGFLFPHVDIERCVDCGLCENVCAFNDNYDKSLCLDHPIAYAMRHIDANEVAASQSGGAFVVLSDYVLDRNGVVYGVGYKNHFVAAHKRAITKEERDEFRRSKYVQSDVNGAFPMVKKDLKAGKIVLFSGTPCQTAGLNSFVGKKLRKNLILVDLVCHAVPSPSIWKDYLHEQELLSGSKAISVLFRDKGLTGWQSHTESIIFANGKKISKDKYASIFYNHIALRKSCGDCHYCNLLRPSDFSIADCWGGQKAGVEWVKDNKGVSLLLCNTEKALSIFKNLKNTESKVINIEECMQNSLYRKPRINPKSADFEKDYIEKGYDYVYNKYIKESLTQQTLRIIKRVLRPLKNVF